MPVAALVHVEKERTFRAALLRGGCEDNPAVSAMATIGGHAPRAARAARDFGGRSREQPERGHFSSRATRHGVAGSRVVRAPKFGPRAARANFFLKSDRHTSTLRAAKKSEVAHRVLYKGLRHVAADLGTLTRRF
jgi:hypothetical protein